MLKIIVPTIIISSTIPLSEKPTFYFDNDYSVEAKQFLDKDIPQDSQDTSNILYRLILEELLKDGV